MAGLDTEHGCVCLTPSPMLFLLFLAASLAFIHQAHSREFSGSSHEDLLAEPIGKKNYVPFAFCILFLIFFLFRVTPVAYRRSQARGWIGAAAASLHYSTARPGLSCFGDLHHSLWQHQILNPLSEARYRTRILMDTSQVCTAELWRELLDQLFLEPMGDMGTMTCLVGANDSVSSLRSCSWTRGTSCLRNHRGSYRWGLPIESCERVKQNFF